MYIFSDQFSFRIETSIYIYMDQQIFLCTSLQAFNTVERYNSIKVSNSSNSYMYSFNVLLSIGEGIELNYLVQGRVTAL